MNLSRHRHLTLVLLVVTASALLAVGSPRSASADPLLCKRALSSESAKYTRTVTTALQKCEDAKVIGTLPPATDCTTNSQVVAMQGRASQRLMRKIASRCGGDDRTCGTADDESLVSIGWGAIGTLPVSLVPATTGTSMLPAPNGAFCPAQTTAGAFGLAGARLIREVGQPLTLAGLGTFTTALGATFCIPASGSSLVDGAVGLPGPGALSISGTTTVNIP